MQSVLRHSRRLSTRIVKRRTHPPQNQHRFYASAWRPDEGDNTEPSEATTKRQESQDEVKIDTQESIDARRQGIRRTLRHRRPAEPPKPPPLPQWFLRKNVVLRQSQAERPSEDKETRKIECVVAESGEVLFTTAWTEELSSLVERDQAEESGGRPTSEATVDVQSESEEVPSSMQDQIAALRQATARSTELEPLSASLIQAELLARASFALAGKNTSTFTASKTGLSLGCTDQNAHVRLNHLVQSLAAVLDADLITLDANDIADLTGDYVGSGNDLPGTFHTLAHDVFEGRNSQDGLALGSKFSKSPDQEENDDEDEHDLEDDKDATPTHQVKSIGDFLKSRLQDMARGSTGAGFGFAIPAGVLVSRPKPDAAKKKTPNSSDYVHWDDARLSALFDQVLDAAKLKRASSAAPSTPQADSTTSPIYTEWQRRTQTTLSKLIAHNITKHQGLPGISLKQIFNVANPQSEPEGRTILHIQDLADLTDSKLGDAIVQRLSKVVQKRRRLGEQIILVGTSAGADRDTEDDDSPLIDVVLPPEAQAMVTSKAADQAKQSVTQLMQDAGYHRILEVNTRNIISMLRRAQTQTDPAFDNIHHDQLLLPGATLLAERVLSQEQVHRIVLGAIGIAKSYMKSDTIQPVHISLSTAILAVNEEAITQASTITAIPFTSAFFGTPPGSKEDQSQKRLEDIRRQCNTHETKLLSGVVDAQNIKTGFADVHVSPETIEALKTLTSLSLLRPDAFKYGVLARDSLSGLMLYGPSGTGKTLLAKAVAKDSNARVLEVSGAQIYEKYVGEGEKMVRAVFTLAKKLSPCIVFIDEADALFGTRNSAGNRNTHREIINQFLREWDGMDDHSVFIMVASNRPFDMDDAVLRRLPRRLLVDLPLASDREKILAIHLRDEVLGSEVSLSKLAEQTPLYSGSDLKNVCIAAALSAVREENDMAAKHQEDDDFKLPEKRTLQLRHFEKGLQEISASINEDMSSLTAIRKFDEQYGDRKGRRKKASYGFGALEGAIDEAAARVRQKS